MRNIDPITMEVIKNALSSIADEMALVIMRTAYSSIVRDSMDYSTGMCDADGRVVAHGLTCPLHLGSFPDAMQQMIGEYSGNMRPGDMFIFNDPYGGGGMHIPDVYIVKPIFLDGELEGYAATLVHQTDLGGLAPGSNAVHATEIYQEGLRIPIVKLFEEGRLNQTIDKVIAKNTRFPDKVRGDMRAQVAACLSAEKAYLHLLEKYGSSTLRSYTEEMHDYAEQLMRTEIEGIPDGVYTYRDYIDGLGDPPEAIVFDLEVTVKGGEIVVDWTGTSPPGQGRNQLPRSLYEVSRIPRGQVPRRAGDPEFRGLHATDPGHRAARLNREPAPSRCVQCSRDRRLPNAGRALRRLCPGGTGARAGGGRRRCLLPRHRRLSQRHPLRLHRDPGRRLGSDARARRRPMASRTRAGT